MPCSSCTQHLDLLSGAHVHPLLQALMHSPKGQQHLSGLYLRVPGLQISQLFKIFQILGTPDESVWPGVSQLQDWQATFPRWPARPLSEVGAAAHTSCRALFERAADVAHTKPTTCIRHKGLVGMTPHGSGGGWMISGNGPIYAI